MKKVNACLAALILLGALPLAAVGAGQGAANTGAGRGESSQMGHGAADAATSAAEVPSQFGAVDANRDGLISRSEAQTSSDLNARFNQLDADRNGQISLSEWQSGEAGPGAAGVSGERRSGSSSVPVMIP